MGSSRSLAVTRGSWPQQEEIRQRRDIIRSDEGLRERDLRKHAALCEAIRADFLIRGVEKPAATLLAV